MTREDSVGIELLRVSEALERAAAPSLCAIMGVCSDRGAALRTPERPADQTLDWVPWRPDCSW